LRHAQYLFACPVIFLHARDTYDAPCVNTIQEKAMHDPEANKAVVRRFNTECIERGSPAAFQEILAPDFVNRTAPPGTPPGPEGMVQFLGRVLRSAFPDLTVEIHDQIAAGDKVVTRKTLHGTHSGVFMGIAPTGKRVAIDVIDIVRIQGGRYQEHWGINTLPSVLADLKASARDR
jgi:predicted ester cyclase